MESCLPARRRNSHVPEGFYNDKIFHKETLPSYSLECYMNNKNFYGLPLIALGMSMGQFAVAVEQKPEGFIEGSNFNILNRNLYFNRDFRNGQSSRTIFAYCVESRAFRRHNEMPRSWNLEPAGLKV